MWLLLLFLPFSTAFPFNIFGPGSPPRPISVDKDKPHLIPRAFSFLLYHSPFHQIPKEIFPTDRSFYNSKTKKLDKVENANWEGILTADWYYQEVKEHKYIQLLNDFFRADPKIRKMEYAGDEICENSAATRVVQLHTDPGLPVDLPCFTCAKRQSGEINEFQIHSERFLNKKASQQMTMEPYVIRLLKTTNSLIKADVSRGVSVLQSAQRRPEGTLQILHSSSILRSFDTVPRKNSKEYTAKKKVIEALQRLQGVQFGASFQCKQISNEDGSEVVVNIDSLVSPEQSHFPYREKYEIYEKWDGKPINVNKGNLKLEVVWERWSCCSACCCSIKQCGVLATEKKCDQVYSVKTRKGYLSLVKENHKQQVKLDQILNKQSSSEYKEAVRFMEKSFEASTYNNSGIPVFSSLIPHILRNDVHEAFTSEFLAIRNITMAEYRGSGLFVEVQSCWDDPQKKDCQMWENCRGSVRNKENEENEEKEVEEDPCKGEEMTTLVMDEISNTFKVHEGRSYRLQVDDSVFPVSKSVRWRTGTVTVPQYDFTKSCLRQKRAVLPNGKHLVLMKLTKKDLQLRIEAKLSMGQKLVAKFSDADARIKETKGVVSVIIWGSVILVCICLLGAFVALMHRLRVHRTQKNLETQRPMEREQTVTEKA